MFGTCCDVSMKIVNIGILEYRIKTYSIKRGNFLLHGRLNCSATSGAGVAYPSGAPELTLVFVGFVLLQL